MENVERAEGVPPELAADLFGPGGLRSLSRDTGVNRSAIRRLVAGEGCSLANLAALSEARPSLVVYVEGVPYRLARVDGMELTSELHDELERGARDGLTVLKPAHHVIQNAPNSCTSCTAEIPKGETALVTRLRGPEGFQTAKYF